MTTAESPTIYRHADDMPEISGFGGGYEKACQDMLEAGCKYLLVDHPEADPLYRGMKNVFGLITDENDDAKALDKAVVAACPDCSGAMHHAVISRLLFIKRNGWEAYCDELRKPATA